MSYSIFSAIIISSSAFEGPPGFIHTDVLRPTGLAFHNCFGSLESDILYEYSLHLRVASSRL